MRHLCRRWLWLAVVVQSRAHDSPTKISSDNVYIKKTPILRFDKEEKLRLGQREMPEAGGAVFLHNDG